MTTFEAKAVAYEDGSYSARVYEFYNGILVAEIWLGRCETESQALDCARQRIAEYWLFMAQTGD